MQLNSKKSILFIGPRLHTNYIGPINSLIKNNYKVHFLAKTKNFGENHSKIKPIILKESIFSKIRKYMLGNIGSNNVQYFPNIYKFTSYIKKIKPNYAIIRLHGRLFTYFSAAILKIFNCKVIFYDQVDVSTNNLSIFKSLEIFLVCFLFQSKIISPICSNKKKIRKNFFFIPFCTKIIQKKKFADKKIKILSIGKYQRRKNHLLLIKTLEDISKKIGVELHIVGEYQNIKQKKFKEKIEKYIKLKKMTKIVKVHKFVKHENIDKFYQNFDLFVLPAEKEIASVSIIEALGKGLPVICGNDCGTKNYIINNYNGFIFKKNNVNSLKKKIILLLNKKRLKKFSLNAHEYSKKYISENNYFHSLNKILK